MSVRAFIAIGLPAEVITGLRLAQDDLRRAVGRLAVKWARPEGMHLTLRFLGDVSGEVVGPLGSALGAACAPVAPFDLAVDGFGCFPSPERARVIWAGLAGDLGSLGLVVGRVNAAAEKFVAAGEEREFVPHITLGRVGEGRREEFRALAEAVVSIRPQAARWRADSVLLMQSILRPQGAEHVRLAECALGAAGHPRAASDR